MDEVVEDVNKMDSFARTNSDEKETEEAFPEQREVHSLGDGRKVFKNTLGSSF